MYKYIHTYLYINMYIVYIYNIYIFTYINIYKTQFTRVHMNAYKYMKNNYFGKSTGSPTRNKLFAPNVEHGS